MTPGAPPLRDDERGRHRAHRDAVGGPDPTRGARRAPAGVIPRTTLAAWLGLVVVLATAAYTANAVGDHRADVLYEWGTAVEVLIQYAVMGAVVLVIARRVTAERLGFVAPASPGRAARLAIGGLAAVFAVGYALDQFLDAGKEQGLLPDGWDGSRAAPFLANAFLVSIAAPLVEETTFRGLGYAAVHDGVGPRFALPVTALAFALAHGLLVALPVLFVFGLILGWLRRETGSIYPCIALHGTFNALALLTAVTMGTS